MKIIVVTSEIWKLTYIPFLCLILSAVSETKLLGLSLNLSFFINEATYHLIKLLESFKTDDITIVHKNCLNVVSWYLLGSLEPYLQTFLLWSIWR
jgi:hypothetical protein